MSFVDRLLRTFFPRPPARAVWVDYDRVRLTPARLYNLHLAVRESDQNRVKLRSRPVKLVIEASNVCNLECPGCFTGVGENGRVRSHISFDLFKQTLDEQASRLCQVEFYNWGEPLLNKSIYRMIEEAHKRGLSTLISTNFSLPYDEARADALVKSGLQSLTVSCDGATQEVYEQYRRGGNLDLVFRNVRLVAEAKKRLGSATPQIMWGWHTFPHNHHEIEKARQMAPGLGFDAFHDAKAWLVEGEWDGPGKYASQPLAPFRCWFLWQYAVVHNDGGVSPCCASFYREDDVGQLSVTPGAKPAKTFGDIWNGPEMQGARAYFDPATPLGDEDNSCRHCPATLNWRAFVEHEAAGGTRENFQSAFKENALPVYMFNRRPKQRDTSIPLRPEKPETAKPVIELAGAGHSLIRDGTRQR